MHNASHIFNTHDSNNSPIQLKHQVITTGPQLATTIKKASEMLVAWYAPIEVDFVYKHPELVPQDFMLKGLTSYLQPGLDNIDQSELSNKVHGILREFFAATEWGNYLKPNDVHYFVTAYDTTTDVVLGIMQFIRSDAFSAHAIKLGLCGIIQSARTRDIELLLVRSIFNIEPDLQKLFLHTRSSNEDMIQRYLAWGFAIAPETIPHWTNLEYDALQSDSVQQHAQHLIR